MLAARLSRKAMRTYNFMNRSLGICLSVATTLALGSCTAVQPKPQCKAQTGEYAARYTVDKMSGACTDKIITGETLSVQYYSPKRDSASDRPKLAIVATRVAEATALGGEHGVDVKVAPDYSTPQGGPSTGSLGPFSSVFPNDKDICVIKTMETSSAQVAAIDKDSMADPPFEGADAVDLSYGWSNLNMLVTPTSNAVYFGADLELKDGDCTVNYKVTAISPVVGCEETMDTTDIDPDTKMPVIDPDTGKTKQVGTGKPNMDACTDDSNGLNLDIDYTCDDKTFLCVPANDYPQKK